MIEYACLGGARDEVKPSDWPPSECWSCGKPDGMRLTAKGRIAQNRKKL